MCGIAGFTTLRGLPPAERRVRYERSIRRMTAALAHRGPDAQTALLLDGAALGHTRLAIIDLSGGAQPMRDPETGLTVVFNGEIFNYVELRDRLAAKYRFRTTSDTEVILAAFLDKGIACVNDFIGQFAFALFDPRSGELFLARDHVGIQPLFYCIDEQGLSFASEVKALFAGERVEPRLDARGLKQTLTLWSPVAPRTAFENVRALEPGTVARFAGGVIDITRYWDVDIDVPPSGRIDDQPTAERMLLETLADAVRLRLRADVPVAAYLSGGIDSSIVCALAQRQLGGTLHTFSVAFAHRRFDERNFQQEVARDLHTQHHVIEIGDEDIGAALPDVVRHGEQVLLRSAPAPFFRLSRFVRESGIKVVLTGEGSDEFLLGYDLYKETKLREFWARQPQSKLRPRLLSRLYPYLNIAKQGEGFLREVFGVGLDDPRQPGFSHLLRWGTCGRIARFFSPAFAASVADEDPAASLLATMPESVKRANVLQRAQWLETRTLLSGYLLSAQGDRMLMGNSVEGRFPFLDHRLIELAARIPNKIKLKGLNEKYLLKRIADGLVPPAVLNRHKFPYRAPIAGALIGKAAAGWSAEWLAAEAVDRVGVFDGNKVAKLVAKLEKGLLNPQVPPSESDAMALTAIASTQLLARELLPPKPPAQPLIDAVEVMDA